MHNKYDHAQEKDMEITGANDHVRVAAGAFQILHKVLVCHNLLGFNDTQLSILLAQCSIDSSVLPHFRPNRSGYTILNNQQLAETHFPSICFSRIICFPHELPFTLTPNKSTSIRLAAIPFLHYSITDMIISNIEVFKLIQQLPCKSSLATKLHIFLCSLRHLPTHQVYPRILRIINIEIHCCLYSHSEAFIYPDQQGKND